MNPKRDRLDGDESQDQTDLEQRLDRLWDGISHSATEQDGRVGHCISHYELRGVLGRGAFGVVYLADDQNSNQTVALKIPRPDVLVDHERRKRFALEAKLSAKLTHPGIVEVLEADFSGPTPFIAAAYCNGPNLAEWIDSVIAPPAWRESAGLVAKVADAVEYAHQQGIFHRDLKPANIMLVAPTGDASLANSLDELVPKVTDFGLAKITDPAVTDTRSSLMLGTPLYMAPEQLDHQTQAKNAAANDIYSLGVILFELLTKQLPTAGNSYFEVLENIRSAPPTKLRKVRKDLPRSLADICAICLQKNPQARYGSAAELAADLRRCVVGNPIKGRTASLITNFSYWCTHRQRLKTAGGFMLGCQALSAFWLTVVSVFIGVFEIVSWNQYLLIMSQVAMLVFVFLVPMCWAGWRIMKGSRRAAWFAMALTLLNLPFALIPIFFEPIIFAPLYAGHHPYFKFAVHMMPVTCFVAQAFILGCALIATRPRKQEELQLH